jgi:hypothetical protein
MKSLLILIIVSLPLLSFGQINDLQQMRIDYENENSQRLERVAIYSKENNVPIIQREGLVTIYLKDIINGKPHFIKTYNSGASATTGASDIGVDGPVGLDLDGSEISIGVWDAGLVRTSHIEFADRVTPSDAASELSGHATHVMGTILSRGVNPAAMGMAVNATAKSFDFLDDDSEMLSNARPDQSGIVLSNHSYGTVTGWNDGTWYGDEDISIAEDYKFGFYTAGAALRDNLVYNSPYYTIVKSAGNDRGDSGDGTHPADGPFDIISTTGTAKNIITIGAVNKLLDYNQPSDVIMSSFSGWGPTDDGRIKPDLVAAGVSVFSTLATADDAYGSLSGTSMSAPNATGTFVLLQQLHKKLNGGNLMKASQLKALVAHTAHEAGVNDGPDYAFGWGLINAAGAADLLIKDDTDGVLVEEFRLMEGESYSMSFDSNIGTIVKATICWTDPPGTIPAPALDPTDLNLVNDLDMRISSSGDDYFPWILNPEFPQVAATTGDNFRDNIEVIEFVPTENLHDLTISHKGTLADGHQDFTLVLTYEPQSSLSSVKYWVGDDNNFETAGNWSNESGGAGGVDLPDNETTVIFDNNSFTTEGPITVQLASDFVSKNFIYLSNKEMTLDIGSNEFKLTGKMTTNSNLSLTGSGNVVFDTDLQEVTVAGSTSLQNMSVVFANETGSWIVDGDLSVGDLDFQAGQIDFNSNTVTASTFITTSAGNKWIDLTNSNFVVSENLDFTGPNLVVTTENSTLSAQGPAVTISGPSQTFNGSILSNDGCEISGFTEVETLDFSGTLTLASDMTIKDLVSGTGSTLVLSGTRVLEIIDLTIDNGEEFFTMSSPEGLSEILINGHRRLCYDYFDISNINLTGEATVSIGASSIISNSIGWIVGACIDVLFSDYSFTYPCINSMVEFKNESLGNFTSAEWTFANQGNSMELNPSFIFSGFGTFPVTLTISNNSYSNVYTKDITLVENDLSKSDISIVGGVLFSSEAAGSYQWYNNGEIIEGATERFYDYNDEEGSYFVVLYSEGCNLRSNELDIIVSAITNDIPGFAIFPNPAKDEVIVVNNSMQEVKIEIVSINGRVLSSVQSNEQEVRVDVSNVSPGLFFLRIHSQNGTILRKIIVQ